MEEKQSIPRYALFIHAGDESAPVWPLLVYTNKNDTSFHKYFRLSNYEQVSKYGFSLSDEKLERMKRYLVNDSIFDLLQGYLIKNNTHETSFIEGSYSGNYCVFLNTGRDSIIYFTLNGSIGREGCQSCDYFDEIIKYIPDFGRRIK